MNFQFYKSQFPNNFQGNNDQTKSLKIGFLSNLMKIENWKLKISLLAICFFATTSGVHAASLIKPANNLGLVGYWSFNEGSSTKAIDYSGNGNTGTLTNMATSPSTPTSGWNNGKLGKALAFDGTDDYVTIGDSNSLDISSDFSISLWVKTSTTANTVILEKSNDNTNYHLHMSGDTAGALQFGITSNASTGRISGTQVVNDNRWHHVVGTFSDSSNTLRLYIDGVLSQSNTGASDTVSGNSQSLLLGSRSGSAAFPGSLDEARIYSRALTQVEISALYQAGAEKISPRASTYGLQAYWPFDETSSTLALDQSGNGNIGTLTNGPTRAAGKLAGAIKFDGSDDYVQMPSMSIVNNSFSATAWFKTTSNGSNFIISNSSNNHPIHTFNGHVRTCTSGNCQEGSTAIDDGVWHFAAVVGDGISIRMYLDGRTTPEYTAAAASDTVTGALSVGRCACTGSNFAGLIDEVRIYNRTLGVAEISEIYRTSGVQKVNSSQNRTGSLLDSGLIGLWSFNGADMVNGVAKDRVGSSDGKLVNIATSTFYSAGKVGQGMNFDGSDDYIDLGDANAVEFTNTDGYTISAWIYPTSSGTLQAIMSRATASGKGWYLEYDNGVIVTQGVFFDYYDGTTVIRQRSDNFQVPLNKWSHVAMTKTAGSNVYVDFKIYVNGVNVTTAGGPATPNSIDYSGTSLEIGSRGASSLFQGKIDEARIYNRELSATEVKQLYNLGK